MFVRALNRIVRGAAPYHVRIVSPALPLRAVLSSRRSGSRPSTSSAVVAGAELGSPADDDTGCPEDGAPGPNFDEPA